MRTFLSAIGLAVVGAVVRVIAQNALGLTIEGPMVARVVDSLIVASIGALVAIVWWHQ